MAKHRRSEPAARVTLTMRPGLAQLTARTAACLLCLVAMTIAINTATDDGGPLIDPTISSSAGPPSGLGHAVLPAVISPSPAPSPTTTPSDPRPAVTTVDDATQEPADTADPAPVEPSPTDRRGRGKPAKPPGKDK